MAEMTGNEVAGPFVNEPAGSAYDYLLDEINVVRAERDEARSLFKEQAAWLEKALAALGVDSVDQIEEAGVYYKVLRARGPRRLMDYAESRWRPKG